MKHLILLLILLPVFGLAQETTQATFVSHSSFEADEVIAINNFDEIFYIKNNAFVVGRKLGSLEYSNVQLGRITSANAFNPLKINLFYIDFNTVIILDNRLAEIFKIDFNKTQLYRNVTHISTGSDNTIWIYNQDTQQLELFDFKTNQTRATTLPITSKALNLKSNYNVCWLLTQDYLYKYNYFGSLLFKIKNNGYTSLLESNGDIYLKKVNELFYLKKETENVEQIKTPKLLIKQFLVTNETLYIYDEEFLHKYQLITN